MRTETFLVGDFMAVSLLFIIFFFNDGALQRRRTSCRLKVYCTCCMLNVLTFIFLKLLLVR